MKRHLLATAIAFVLTATPAHAVPVAAVAAALATAGVTSAVVATVATFLVNTAISTALSYAAGKVFGPKIPKGGAAAAQERQASVLALSVGEAPREVLFGEVATGGSLAAAFNYGGSNGTDWVVKVVIVADHRCAGLQGVFVNDTYVGYPGDGAVTGYNGQLEIHWRDGVAGQVFPPALMAAWRSSPMHSATAPTTDTPYVGQAYIVFAYKADAPDAQSPTWSGSHPQFLPVVRGKLCYDPRRDTTVGGSGVHRWNDPSTWEYSRNPAVCRYNWARGIYALDQVDEPGHLLVGRGLTTFEAPPARVFAYANLCDEPVDDGEGGLEPRYAVDGVIRAADEYLAVEHLFEAATAGRIIQPDGGVEVEPGQAKTPVYSFTDNDLVVGAALTFNAFRSDGDRVNTVIPRYVEPAQKWQDHAGPVRRDLADLTLDGGAREETLALSLVTSSGQAQRVAEIRRRSARLERTAQVTLGPRFSEAEAGDWVVWTSARHTGGQPVAFRIISHSADAGWQNTWALEEIAFDVYGFGGAPLPAGPGQSPVPLPAPLALVNVTVEAIQLEAEGLGGVPAIRFGWEAPVDPGVVRIRAEVRKVGDTRIAATTTDAVSAGGMDVTNGVAPDSGLEARLVPLGAPGRAIVPSSWVLVATGELRASSVGTIGGYTPEEILARAAEAANQGKALVKTSLEFFLRAVEERRALVQQTFHDGEAVKRIVVSEDESFEEGRFSLLKRLQLMGVVVGDASAFQFNDTTLKASASETWGQYKTALATTLGNNSAAIATETTARSTADSAFASSLSSVSSTVGSHTASITTLQSSVNGISAEYLVVVASGTHRASFRQFAGPTLSSIIFAADEIGFTNGATDKFPFAIVGGVLRATNMEIDTIKANVIVTGHIVGSAVTQITWAEQAYGFNLTTSAAQVFALSHTTSVSGAGHKIDFYCTFVNAGANAGVVVSVKRDGAVIGVRNFFANGPFTTTLTSFVFDQPGSGGHSYTLEAQTTAGSGAACQLNVSGMTVTELKR